SGASRPRRQSQSSGGNITGISTMNLDLGSKWIELLHELRPAAQRFAVLVNIENADSARSIITPTQEPAFALVNADLVFVRTILPQPGPRSLPHSPPIPIMGPTRSRGQSISLGGKIRGTTCGEADLGSKWIELLHELRAGRQTVCGPRQHRE